MATRRRRVAWTEHAGRMLDEAVAHIAQDSRPAAERLLIRALDAGSSLDMFGERGRIVPELGEPDVRELFVDRLPTDLRGDSDPRSNLGVCPRRA